MMEFATDMLQSAVSEAQRCFAAPLDHTRQNVKPPPELANAAARLNAQTANLGHVGADPTSTGKLERGPLPKIDWDLRAKASCPNQPPPQQQNTTPWKDVGARSTTAPHQPSSAHISQTSTQPTSFSVTVVDKDGSTKTSSVNVPNTQEHGQSAAPTVEDTLTQRTSAQALAKEIDGGSKLDLQTQLLQQAKARREWELGSVLEVYSASLNCWYPALVMQVAPDGNGSDMMKVQFWLDIDDAKSKTLGRSDEQLQPLGTHCKNQLPPGFQPRPSKSKPGQSVFLDRTNGFKYESAELAWAAHFQRWLASAAPAGTQTISSLAGVAAAAMPPTNPQQVVCVVPGAEGLDTQPIEQRPEAPKKAVASQMDSEVAEGLVTEYAMSREVAPVANIQMKAGVVPQVLSRTESGPAKGSAMGLVTEYETDWNKVRSSSSPSKDFFGRGCPEGSTGGLLESSSEAEAPELPVVAQLESQEAPPVSGRSQLETMQKGPPPEIQEESPPPPPEAAEPAEPAMQALAPELAEPDQAPLCAAPAPILAESPLTPGCGYQAAECDAPAAAALAVDCEEQPHMGFDNPFEDPDVDDRDETSAGGMLMAAFNGGPLHDSSPVKHVPTEIANGSCPASEDMTAASPTESPSGRFPWPFDKEIPKATSDHAVDVEAKAVAGNGQGEGAEEETVAAANGKVEIATSHVEADQIEAAADAGNGQGEGAEEESVVAVNAKIEIATSHVGADKIEAAVSRMYEIAAEVAPGDSGCQGEVATASEHCDVADTVEETSEHEETQEDAEPKMADLLQMSESLRKRINQARNSADKVTEGAQSQSDSRQASQPASQHPSQPPSPRSQEVVADGEAVHAV